MAKTQSETQAKRVRVRRAPTDGARDILAVANQDPNYVYRWVNDTPGRIQRLMERGYEIVTDHVEVGQSTVDRGSQLGGAVTKQVGQGVTGVLMRIPREYHEEDQAAKDAENDAIEAAMKQEAMEGRYGRFTVTSASKNK